MKGMDHSHDSKIYPERDMEFWVEHTPFILNIRFRKSPARGPIRKSRNDLGEKEGVSSTPSRERPQNTFTEWMNKW